MYTKRNSVVSTPKENKTDPRKFWRAVNTPDNGFLLDLILMGVMQKSLRGIHINKASGIKDISCSVLKDAFIALHVELIGTFNESLRSGVFPRDWIIRSITPITKEGDAMNLNNWRPVMITS